MTGDNPEPGQMLTLSELLVQCLRIAQDAIEQHAKARNWPPSLILHAEIVRLAVAVFEDTRATARQRENIQAQAVVMGAYGRELIDQFKPKKDDK